MSTIVRATCARLTVVLMALAWLLISHGAHAQAGTCRVARTVCIDATDRMINGTLVSRPCWEYRDEYECVDPGAANYCAGIQAQPGCTMQSVVCNETAFNGTCTLETKTYACSSGYTGPPLGVVDLGATYTITSSSLDLGTCATPGSNPACVQTGPQTCVDGPGYKMVNGVSVFQECWEWSRTYACSVSDAVNFCQPLALAGCVESPGTATCVETGPDGVCNKTRRNYVCTDHPPVAGTNIVTLDTTYTIRTDSIDESGCTSVAGNAACAQPPTSVCVQGPETRIINGLPVYKDCWQWQRTYSCATSDAADFCAPLRTLGCTEQSSVCDVTGPDGACSSYTKTFACLNNTGVTGTNVVNLNTSYTIRNDYLDVSACADAASNPACTIATEVCVEPGETRVINGLPVYKPCWKYERTYTCTVAGGANYCAPIAATAGCAQSGTTCIEYGTNGACIATEATYRCDNAVGDPLPPNVTFLNNVYTIVSDTINNGCSTQEGNAGCTILTEVCAEPGGTRIINGLPVYKPCWRWDRTYICQDPGNAINECAPYENNPRCTLSRQACSLDKFTGMPDCGLTTKVFSCQVRPAGSTNVQTCFEQSCVGPMCGRERDPADPDFAKSVAVMELQRQAGGYMDAQGRIFSGIPAQCERRLFGSSNCCREQVSSTNGSNNVVFATRGVSFVGENVANIGSAYVWDGLFGTATNLYPEISGFAGGNVSRGYAAQAAQATSISMYGITATVQTYANAGTFMESFSVTWSFDPTSFAIQVGIQVLTNMAACNQDEQTLALRKGQRLCTFVGGYRTGTIWRRSYEGYCCYNSRLARIVQEQGRRQLGRGYGSAQNPDCTGLTAEELERLDFSQIDLSEFIADVQSKAMDTTAALNRFATRGTAVSGSAATNRNDAIAQYMPATQGSTGAVAITPGAPGAPPAQTPRTNDVLRGCQPPTVVDEIVGACRDPAGYYYEPRTMVLMPCARGFVKDSLVPACVDPSTGKYYPLNSTVPMPCPVGQYLAQPEGVCKEPTAP